MRAKKRGVALGDELVKPFLLSHAVLVKAFLPNIGHRNGTQHDHN